MEAIGAERPALLEEDAPVLSGDALSAEGFYLVGLIGGKDVGKSALVNALAGRNITATSSYGPGTEGVIAYAHASQEQGLHELLERNVPGQFRIVTHELPELRRQVLLDLPDIDSHFASHLQVTRAMLRHMLYPVWVQSVEKYADRQPQQMLARVAAGNAPKNFVFCLNKADQLSGTAEHGAELASDFAARIQKTLGLEAPPKVHLISATHPDQFDLPALRTLLAREKTAQAVRASQELAANRQDRSLLAWVDHQQLPLRAQRLARLQQDAEDLTAQRVAQPLIDQVIPRLLDDPSSRGTMAEEILTERVARWPLVRLVHTLLSPLFVLLRGATARTAAPLQTPQGLVELVLRETGYSVSDLVQTTFAQLRQSQPGVGELYAHNRLWEQMPADRAAAELRRLLGQTVQQQRDAARERLTRGGGWSAPLRWMLTVGAVLWFPFIQPILETILNSRENLSLWTWTQRMAVIVSVLGVNYLLKSAGFLILYFVALWLALRWNTQRRVNRLLEQWRPATLADPSLNLAAQTLLWTDGLIAPIAVAHDRLDALARRAEALRSSARAA